MATLAIRGGNTDDNYMDTTIASTPTKSPLPTTSDVEYTNQVSLRLEKLSYKEKLYNLINLVMMNRTYGFSTRYDIHMSPVLMSVIFQTKFFLSLRLSKKEIGLIRGFVVGSLSAESALREINKGERDRDVEISKIVKELFQIIFEHLLPPSNNKYFINRRPEKNDEEFNIEFMREIRGDYMFSQGINYFFAPWFLYYMTPLVNEIEKIPWGGVINYIIGTNMIYENSYAIGNREIFDKKRFLDDISSTGKLNGEYRLTSYKNYRIEIDKMSDGVGGSSVRPTIKYVLFLTPCDYFFDSIISKREFTRLDYETLHDYSYKCFTEGGRGVQNCKNVSLRLICLASSQLETTTTTTAVDTGSGSSDLSIAQREDFLKNIEDDVYFIGNYIKTLDEDFPIGLSGYTNLPIYYAINDAFNLISLGNYKFMDRNDPFGQILKDNDYTVMNTTMTPSPAALLAPTTGMSTEGRRAITYEILRVILIDKSIMSDFTTRYTYDVQFYLSTDDDRYVVYDILSRPNRNPNSREQTMTDMAISDLQINNKTEQATLLSNFKKHAKIMLKTKDCFLLSETPINHDLTQVVNMPLVQRGFIVDVPGLFDTDRMEFVNCTRNLINFRTRNYETVSVIFTRPCMFYNNMRERYAPEMESWTNVFPLEMAREMESNSVAVAIKTFMGDTFYTLESVVTVTSECGIAKVLLPTASSQYNITGSIPLYVLIGNGWQTKDKQTLYKILLNLQYKTLTRKLDAGDSEKKIIVSKPLPIVRYLHSLIARRLWRTK